MTDAARIFDPPRRRGSAGRFRRAAGRGFPDFRPPPPDLEAQESTPGAPASVSLSRADGTVTASWPAVSGATKYHATYSTDGGSSWHAPVNNHTNITDNSLTFNADNAKSYIVGVRAGNDSDQWSGWRNSPSSGPFTPNPAPGPVSAVTVTRADGSLTANWPAVSGATKYHVTYTVNGSGNWKLADLNHAGSSIDITGVDNTKSYVVGVRAGNSTGWSGWVNSPAAGPYTPPQPTPTPEPTPTPTPTPQPPPAAPTGLTATAGDQSVTLAWNDPADSSITGYEYRTRWAGVAWGEWTAISVANSHTVTGLENGTEYRFKLRAVNAGGSSKPGPQSAPWYVAATPQVPPPAPTGLTVTPGNGYLDVAWDAVTDATGYDVKAKTSGSSDWHDVASNVTATSYRYTTSQAIDYVAVRARNTGGPGPWAELSRAPSAGWLTTVIQGGASGQSVQAQNQLAAPASITVTRDNSIRDEKLYVTWAAVSGADGYNLACTAGSGTPLSGWNWWHCGSVASGSTTTFTVDHDKRGGVTRDLAWSRSYTVAVRAVTTSPTQAGPWVVSTEAQPAYEPDDITASRADGSVSISWTAPQHVLTHTEGYEIQCATRTGNVSAAYTVCADVADATPVNGKLSATISSWTAGGTDYTIDDSKTYDLRVRTTNDWGESGWRFVPFIYPVVKLTVSDVGISGATLTIANHSDAWYYKANAAPDNTCQDQVNAGTSKKVLGRLSVHTAYEYTAYSDSACTAGNELATAWFTTLSSVSNLGSTKSGNAAIHSVLGQAVAFTTGPSSKSANGYILKSVKLPMKNLGGSQGVVVKLYEMEGTGAYTKDSVPKRNAVANATLSGTAPTSTSSSWTDTIYTCSGSGCKLESGKTYFVTLISTEETPAYAMAYALTESEEAHPSGNGWSVGYGHYKSGNDEWATYSTADWNIAQFVFAHAPTLTSRGITGTGAKLTLNHYNDGNWYYKADAAPHTTCQGPVSSASTTLSALTSNTTYTYTAYSDSACTTANKLAEAEAFTTATTSSVSNLSSTKVDGSGKIHWMIKQAVAFTTGTANSSGYILETVTIPLKYEGGSTGILGMTLHTVDGSGDYSSSSVPSREKVANATFSSTTPIGSSWTDTTWSCSGSGCKLDTGTTYFVVASSNAQPPGYGWAYTETHVETKTPSNNGWSIGFGHNDNENLGGWNSFSDWSLAKFVFTNAP